MHRKKRTTNGRKEKVSSCGAKKRNRGYSPGAAVLPREGARTPAVGTLSRTNRLILAAIRVWEFKREFGAKSRFHG